MANKNNRSNKARGFTAADFDFPFGANVAKPRTSGGGKKPAGGGSERYRGRGGRRR